MQAQQKIRAILDTLRHILGTHIQIQIQIEDKYRSDQVCIPRGVPQAPAPHHTL